MEDSLDPKAVELIPSLRNELGAAAEGVSDSNLLKFLHWKPDVERASARFRSLLEWRKENSWAMDDTRKPLLASEDPELKRVLESDVIVAPDGLVDKKGSTVLVGRLRNNDMSDGRQATDVCRMILYTIDRVLERKSTLIHGITIFHDMNGLSKKNVDVSIPKLLVKALVGHLPIRIQGIYILNAPLFFRGIFSVISLMLPAKLRARTHFFKDIKEVYEIIDKDQLLVEHGGKRMHDSSQWVADQIHREENGTLDSLKDCAI